MTADNAHRSSQEIADEVGVSVPTIDRVKTILEEGSKEQIKALDLEPSTNKFSKNPSRCRHVSDGAPIMGKKGKLSHFLYFTAVAHAATHPLDYLFRVF